MPYYLYGFNYMDMSYVLVLVAMVFTVITSYRVKSTFNKYSKDRLPSGVTGYDAARRVLDANGLRHVKIEHTSGSLTDHFDPRTNVIRLSDTVYGEATAAAVGVAAHEAGHAIQYAKGYAPLKLRNAIIPITNIGSRLSTPLILIGILLASAGSVFIYIAYAGVALFALSTVFQLLTLPTEFNASRRALAALSQGGILSGSELGVSKKVLSAAAMTYVAALAVSVTQFIRLLSIVMRNQRRR